MSRIDLDKQKFSKLIYDNPLQQESDIAGFKLEGEAEISFAHQKMRMQNLTNPKEGQKANFVLWCPEEFSENFRAQWEFTPIRDPGLCIFFFSAGGINGEDLFDPKLAPRTGEYKLYHHGDINAFHISYFRRRWPQERAFHLCNLRKSYGFHMVAQGADPLPSVEDVDGSYMITVVKDEADIRFYIDELLIFSWHDDGNSFGPKLGAGKMGFRQMAPLVAEYSNFKVFSSE